MCERFNLEEEIILDSRLKRFLKFKNNNVKLRFLLNFILCNYFEDDKRNIKYDDAMLYKFYINNDFKTFLEKNNFYYGDDYSINGVKILLENFIKKSKIEIII